MAANREHQKFLIKLIDDMLNDPDNSWAVEDVANALAKHIPKREIGSYAIAQRIDRHCIEDVGRKQAVEFYREFKVQDIQGQLIEDFMQMEHERRRNNFQNFSLHMFQL
jgi:hypothetical protein